jgi:uncharacterized protein with GYD domain
MLMNLTEQGIKDIKNAPQRVEEAVKFGETLGGKLVDFYVTMGEYDYVVIAEGTSDENMMKFLVGLGAAGNVRTKTLKAFTLAELTELVKDLP